MELDEIRAHKSKAEETIATVINNFMSTCDVCLQGVRIDFLDTSSIEKRSAAVAKVDFEVIL